MAYKRMYYLISIDKRKEYYKNYYQQNKDRYKQRYEQKKIKLKEEHNDIEHIKSKLWFAIAYLFFAFYIFILIYRL